MFLQPWDPHHRGPLVGPPTFVRRDSEVLESSEGLMETSGNFWNRNTIYMKDPQTKHNLGFNHPPFPWSIKDANFQSFYKKNCFFSKPFCLMGGDVKPYLLKRNYVHSGWLSWLQFPSTSGCHMRRFRPPGGEEISQGFGYGWGSQSHGDDKWCWWPKSG